MNKKINILIVDDNIDFARLLNDFIMKHDDLCVVGMAKDGIEAIEMIKVYSPDVVILDIIMPNMDGLGVLEKFHNAEAVNKPLFIVLSAIGQDIFIQRAISLGAEYYILKPFDVSILISRIRQIYQEKHVSSFFHDNTYSTQYNQNNHDISEEDNVEISVTNILRKVGISPHMSGYKYLRAAILYAIEVPAVLNSITRVLYPYIASKFNSTPQKVERAMRNAIGKAWKEVNPKKISSLFGHVITSKRKPSNSEFIALISDKIRVGMR